MATIVLKSKRDQFNFTRRECGIFCELDSISFVDECPEGKKVCPVSGVILDEDNYVNVTLKSLFGDNRRVRCWARIPIYHFDSFVKCKDCGIITCDEKKVAGGGYVCKKCIANYYACESCGEYHRIEKAHEVNGNLYCDECYKKYMHKCKHCGKMFFRRWERCDGDGNPILACDECIESHYHHCGCCGRYYPKDSEEISLYVDEYFCDRCKNRMMSDIDREVIGYHCFNGSKYKIGRRKMSDEKGNGLLYYGVELETEHCHFDDVDVSSWLEDGNLIHAESDGSLDDDTGVEWITLPCTLKYHRDEFNWKGFCRELVREGVRSHNTTTCGLHVHVNRDGLTPSVISKMDFLINRMKMLGIILARRNKFYSADYRESKKLEWNIGYWNNIQQGLLDNIRHRDPYRNPETGCNLSHDNRYRAVNTTNQYTVEVRIFRGTLNPETIIATLEYVDAIIAFAKQAKHMLFKKGVSNAVLCHEFISFLYEHPKEWPSLLPVLRRLSKRNKWRCTYIAMVGDEADAVIAHIRDKSEHIPSDITKSCYAEDESRECYDDDDDDDDDENHDEEDY